MEIKEGFPCLFIYVYVVFSRLMLKYMRRKYLFHGNKIEYQISTFFYIYYDSYENIYKPYGKSKMWK